MEIMPVEVAGGSVDMVLCDLPYGVLNKSNPGAKWDCELSLEDLFDEYERIIKPRGVIILFGSGMFTAKLMMCRPRLWRYNLIWCKGDGVTGFLNANRMPLRNHEDVCVFYKNLPVYHPQFLKDGGKHSRGGNSGSNNINGRFHKADKSWLSDSVYPRSVMNFRKPSTSSGIHPTAKPVELLSYLIRMYTDKGALVLDNTCGSGSTCVACVETERRFIGIEKDERFYETACRRVLDEERMKEYSLFG